MSTEPPDHAYDPTGGAAPLPAEPRWQGTITSSGRPGEDRAGKGAVPARRVRVEGPEGQALEFGHGPPPGAQAVRVRSVRNIGFHRFDVCPICLAGEPGTREHVPPSSLGGAVATLVCARCNNELGSRIEVALLDWRDGAVRGARASGGDVPGRRKIARLLNRATPDGRFVLVPDGRTDPTVRDMLAAGEVELTISPPDPRRYRLAALKHAYLAACLDRREIPDTDTARTIRHDLVAFRDAPRDGPVPDSDYARAMPLMRSYAQPGGPPITLCLADTGRDDGQQEVWILLAGTVAVPWPMPDFTPLLADGTR